MYVLRLPAAPWRARVEAEVVDPYSGALDMETIVRSVQKTHRVVVAHEAVRFCGVGARSPPRSPKSAFDYLTAAHARRRPFQSRPLQPRLKSLGARRDDIVAAATSPIGGLTGAQPVYLPKGRLTMEEALLTRWLVEDGATHSGSAHLRDGDPKKVDMEVEADGRGISNASLPRGRSSNRRRRRRLLAPGETLPDSLGDQLRLSPKRRNGPGALMPSSSSPGQPKTACALRPALAACATENGIDLTAISRSGPDGRIPRARRG